MFFFKASLFFDFKCKTKQFQQQTSNIFNVRENKLYPYCFSCPKKNIILSFFSISFILFFSYCGLLLLNQQSNFTHLNFFVYFIIVILIPYFLTIVSLKFVSYFITCEKENSKIKRIDFIMIVNMILLFVSVYTNKNNFNYMIMSFIIVYLLYVLSKFKKNIIVSRLFFFFSLVVFFLTIFSANNIERLQWLIVYNFFLYVVFFLVDKFVLGKFNLLEAGYLILEKFEYGNKKIFFDKKKHLRIYDFFYYIKYIPIIKDIDLAQDSDIKNLLVNNIIKIENLKTRKASDKSELISKIKLWLLLPLIVTYANLMFNFFFFGFYINPCGIIIKALIVISFLWVSFSVFYLISFNKALYEKFLPEKKYKNNKIKQFVHSALEVVEPKKFKDHIFIDKYYDITIFVDVIRIASFLITGCFISLLTVLMLLSP